MSKFVFYLRTKEGHIERLGNMIAIGPESLLILISMKSR